MKTFIVLVVFVGIGLAADKRSTLKDLSRRAGATMIRSSSGDACTGDKLHRCAQYGRKTCTNPDFSKWAHDNCCAYCDFDTSSVSSATMLGSSSGAACTGDKLPRCAKYGTQMCTNPDFSQWAHDNCCAYCHFGTSSVSSGCADTIPNCADYTTSVCSSADFASWVTTHCAKFCNKCPAATSTGVVSQIPSSVDQTGSSSGCVYAGKEYQQGQTWKDGCKFGCACIDGSTGKYQCSSLCIQYDLAYHDPCHFNPAPADKCCPVLSCPYDIQYPPGYVAQ